VKNRAAIRCFVSCSVCVCVAALAGPGRALAQDLNPRGMYETCAPSVVMVTAAETLGRGLLNRGVDMIDPFPLLDTPGDVLSFFAYPVYVLFSGLPKAGGSGVIIDEQGHFITNHHVVARRNVFWATLDDRRVIRAVLVGSDAEEDYALLKLQLKKGEKVAPAKLGDSDALRPGDPIFAIGSPLGHRQSLSVGVVAGLERRMVGPFQDFIQMDLTIGAGSSGGPLFNARGEVVGLTSMMHAVLEQTGDITLSIPINSVTEGLERLKRDGKVTRGFIGAHVKDVTPRLVKELGLKVKTGACVVGFRTPFWRRSPAEDAGLERGDVIVKYGAKKIDRARALARAVLNTKPGTRVAVEFYRGKRHIKGTIIVARR